MKGRLYNVAKRYIETIERMELTHDKQILAQLEEERVIWHNKLIDILRREGVPYKDREHVTRLAYQVIQWME